jgi:lipopolysaccharide export system protein LptA
LFSLKRTRWLLLVAIVIIAGAVGFSYLAQKELLRRQAPARPKALPNNITASANKWVWSERVGGQSSVEIRADSFQQIKDPPRFELEGVELRIFDKHNTKFDLVKSAHATFNPGDATLYSDGAVEITMNEPLDNQPAGRLVNIQSSGVTFNSRTATATTERPTKFKFDQGKGESLGANYDSTTRELILKNQVRVTWNGNHPGAKPMTVEAGQMIYKELASHIMLFPWSRLKREGLTMDAADSTVNLKKGLLDSVDAKQARGVELTPGRKMEFAAQDLHMEFTEKGLAKKVNGVTAAMLASSSATARTVVNSDRLDLTFEPQATESLLRLALATGHSVVESKPLPQGNKPLPDTRVLRSEVIQLKMKEGGDEIESVETQTPGKVEFLPNRPGQPKRTMNGERIWITYGAENMIQSVRSVTVTTLTEPDKKNAKPYTTSSANMMAHFDPKTGQLANMEQWGDFKYDENARKATAAKATLEQATDVINLTGGSRVWDDTGSVTAANIVLDRKSDDFTATGDVASSRLPDKKGGATMLSKDEPVQARAAKMVSKDKNRHIHYEGNAVMWQAANRIQADSIDVDRANDKLLAVGSVVSQFVDQAKAGQKQPQTAIYTVIKAPRLEYGDKDRLAYYSGGSSLKRPNLDVKAAEIRAWLKPDDKPEPKAKDAKPAPVKAADAKPEESDAGSLDKVFADGQVHILQTSPQRTRDGTGEHAEYYADEQKMVLTGGNPLLVDSLRGQTRGRILTWWAQDDHLLVDNTGSGPAVSRIVKKPKK